jgi:hypothetical protein
MSKINPVHWASLLPLLDKTKKDTKGRSNRIAVIKITAGWVIMAVLVACNSGSSPPTQALPSTPTLEGVTLLEARCSVCHSADRVKQAKETREQWGQTVSRMIGKGAKLTEAEKAVLVDYLAKTYGP